MASSMSTTSSDMSGGLLSSVTIRRTGTLHGNLHRAVPGRKGNRRRLIIAGDVQQLQIRTSAQRFRRLNVLRITGAATQVRHGQPARLRLANKTFEHVGMHAPV